MNSLPLVSIIVLNWNGKQWMDKCLTSIRQQDYQNIETIFVDNRSTDGSVEYLKLKFPWVRVIENDKNYGFAKGNNIGINAAEGELILLLNNDTWIRNDLVSNLVKEKAEKGYDVIAPLEAKYDGLDREPYATTLDILGHPVVIDKPTTEVSSFYLRGVALLFDKDLIDEVGGFDESFFMYVEECDWFWRLNLQKKHFGYSHDNFVYHAGAGSTGKGIKEKVFLWRNENTPQMLLKNYSFVTLCWVTPLYLVQNFIEIIFFTILMKPKISLTYIRAVIQFASNFNTILARREIVQKNRTVSDSEIIKKMYRGLGKLRHLVKYYA
jgi:GT2 family glycosyltransferase